MQIREQGRKIQCIRTVYDKAIGRGRQVVVATLPRWSTSLMPSEDGLAQLNDAEREQLEAFLAQRRADAEESNSRYTAMSASSWLATLAKSIKEGQLWDANKVSSLEIKCHPEQSGSGLVRPLEPPMIAACKAAIREEISKVTIEINDLRFQVRMTLYSHGSGVFRPFEGRCEALG